MGFYGNISNLNRSSFIFDLIYSNRHALEGDQASKDGVAVSRYVLVDYNKSIFKDGKPIQTDTTEFEALAGRSAVTEDEALKSEIYAVGRDENGLPVDEEIVSYNENAIGDLLPVTCMTKQNKFITVTGTEENSIKFKTNVIYYFQTSDGPLSIIQMSIGTYKSADGTSVEYLGCRNLDGELYHENKGTDAYAQNYQIDRFFYNNSKGFDATVWQKNYVNGELKYVQIAELNTVVPSFDLAIDPPQLMTPGVMQTPYFDKSSTNVYYKLHTTPNWKFRIREATKANKLHSDLNMPATDYIKYTPSGRIDEKEYVALSDKQKPAALYYNAAGFDIYNSNFSEIERGYAGAIDDKIKSNYIKIEPTGKSGYPYAGIEGEAADIQELNVQLPAIGNMLARGYNRIFPLNKTDVPLVDYNGAVDPATTYALDGVIFDKNGQIDEDKTLTHRYTDSDWKYVDDNTSNLSFDRRTIVGSINTFHNALGMIIKKENTFISPGPKTDPNFIYYNESNNTYNIVVPNTVGDKVDLATMDEGFIMVPIPFEELNRETLENSLYYTMESEGIYRQLIQSDDRPEKADLSRRYYYLPVLDENGELIGYEKDLEPNQATLNRNEYYYHVPPVYRAVSPDLQEFDPNTQYYMRYINPNCYQTYLKVDKVVNLDLNKNYYNKTDNNYYYVEEPNVSGLNYIILSDEDLAVIFPKINANTDHPGQFNYSWEPNHYWQKKEIGTVTNPISYSISNSATPEEDVTYYLPNEGTTLVPTIAKGSKLYQPNLYWYIPQVVPIGNPSQDDIRNGKCYRKIAEGTANDFGYYIQTTPDDVALLGGSEVFYTSNKIKVVYNRGDNTQRDILNNSIRGLFVKIDTSEEEAEAGYQIEKYRRCQEEDLRFNMGEENTKIFYRFKVIDLMTATDNPKFEELVTYVDDNRISSFHKIVYYQTCRFAASINSFEELFNCVIVDDLSPALESDLISYKPANFYYQENIDGKLSYILADYDPEEVIQSGDVALYDYYAATSVNNYFNANEVGAGDLYQGGRYYYQPDGSKSYIMDFAQSATPNRIYLDCLYIAAKDAVEPYYTELLNPVTFYQPNRYFIWDKDTETFSPAGDAEFEQRKYFNYPEYFMDYYDIPNGTQHKGELVVNRTLPIPNYVTVFVDTDSTSLTFKWKPLVALNSPIQHAEGEYLLLTNDVLESTSLFDLIKERDSHEVLCYADEYQDDDVKKPINPHVLLAEKTRVRIRGTAYDRDLPTYLNDVDLNEIHQWYIWDNVGSERPVQLREIDKEDIFYKDGQSAEDAVIEYLTRHSSERLGFCLQALSDGNKDPAHLYEMFRVNKIYVADEPGQPEHVLDTSKYNYYIKNLEYGVAAPYSVYGLILKLTQLLNTDDPYTRDSSTIGGCLNLMKDSIATNTHLEPGYVSLVNIFGKFQGAPLVDDKKWIKTQVWYNNLDGNNPPKILLSHRDALYQDEAKITIDDRTGIMTLNDTINAVSERHLDNVTPAFGSTFNIDDLHFDPAGHIAYIETHTVQIPKGSLVNTAFNGSDVLTDLAFVPETGKLTTSRTLLENIKLDGTITLKARLENIDQDILDEINARILDVNAEETRAQGVENELRTDLDNEITRAVRVDGELNDKIDAEIERAEDAEADLTAALDAEKQRAEGIEQNLSGRIDAEQNRADEAEQELSDAIGDEATARSTEDTRLAGLITTLESKVDLNKNTLDAEDAELGEKIVNLVSDLEDENTRATTAEENLSERLDAVEGLVGEDSVSQQISDYDTSKNFGDIITHNVDEFDAAGSAETAEENSKQYADDAITALGLDTMSTEKAEDYIKAEDIETTYLKIADVKIPECTATVDGKYQLICNIVDGEPSYSWELIPEESEPVPPVEE